MSPPRFADSRRCMQSRLATSRCRSIFPPSQHVRPALCAERPRFATEHISLRHCSALCSSSAKPLPSPATGSGRVFAPFGAREDPGRRTAGLVDHASSPAAGWRDAGARSSTHGILRHYTPQNDRCPVILSEAKDPVRRTLGFVWIRVRMQAERWSTSSYIRDSSA